MRSDRARAVHDHAFASVGTFRDGDPRERRPVELLDQLEPEIAGILPGLRGMPDTATGSGQSAMSHDAEGERRLTRLTLNRDDDYRPPEQPGSGVDLADHVSGVVLPGHRRHTE